MTQRELRNIIVKQLHTYLAGPKVVLSDQTAPEADYPLIYYQSVQQYRNQINHASASDLGLQSERVLPLDTEHIKETLQKIAAYLHEIRPLKRNVPQGVKALPVTKTIPAGAVPNL